MKSLIILLLFICLTVVKGDFAVAPPIDSADFIVYGNGADVNSSRIQLTLGAPETGGRVIYSANQDISSGFVSEITYQSFDCDNGQWQGADGFTFFLGPNIGASVDSMTYGGDLAIANISRAVVIAFYISGDPNPIEPTNVVYCGADPTSNLAGNGAPLNSPLCTSIYVPELFNIRCTNRSHNFNIRYIPPNTWQISLDDQQISTFTGLLPSIYFSETFVQVGLSGGTGFGFMRQDITSWSFTSSSGIIPYLECFENFENGTYRAHLGYNNLGSSPVTLTVGTVDNKITPQTYSSYFPSTFAPGRTLTHPMAAFTFDWDGSEISWYLTDYLVTFNGSMTERLCPKDLKVQLTFATSGELADAEILTLSANFANFSEISTERVTCVMAVYKALAKKKRQVNDLEAELQLVINEADETFADEPSAEQTVIDFVTNANQNTSIADPILNPNSEGRELLGAKPANGNELPGLVPVTPGTPISSPSISVPISTPSKTPVKLTNGSASQLFSSLALILSLLLVL